VSETESLAIISAVENLTGEESQSKEEIVSGFFSGEGELQGVTCKGVPLVIGATTLTGVITSDSRLIEIAQAVKHLHQHPSGEEVVEDVVHEPAFGAETTEHGQAGGLLFVHESEIDNEIDAPAVEDVPPADEPALREVETVQEQQPAEVTEPVGASALLTRKFC
jgi:hypothetical protein